MSIQNIAENYTRETVRIANVGTGMVSGLSLGVCHMETGTGTLVVNHFSAGIPCTSSRDSGNERGLLFCLAEIDTGENHSNFDILDHGQPVIQNL
ncbi:MAG: hypothetical protein ABIK68_07075, partial [bacterium]